MEKSWIFEKKSKKYQNLKSECLGTFDKNFPVTWNWDATWYAIETCRIVRQAYRFLEPGLVPLKTQTWDLHACAMQPHGMHSIGSIPRGKHSPINVWLHLIYVKAYSLYSSASFVIYILHRLHFKEWWKRAHVFLPPSAILELVHLHICILGWSKNTWHNFFHARESWSPQFVFKSKKSKVIFFGFSKFRF